MVPKADDFRLLMLATLLFLSGVRRLSCDWSGDHADEYCDTEVLRAECADGEVLVMEKAHYGRMKIGRCVEIPMGNVGCFTDVLRPADRRCSGRRVCELRVPDAEFEASHPCLRELKTYLEASYTCIKVETVDVSSCRSADRLNVSSSSGFIASVTSPDVYHCSDDIPGYRWIIRGRPPQRINLTLYDFSPSSSSSVPQSNPPYDVYGDSAVAAGAYEDDPLPWPPQPPSQSSPRGARIDAPAAPTEMCRRAGLIEEEEEEEATGGGGGRRRTDICTGEGSSRVDRISHLYLSEGSDVRIWLSNDVVAERQEDRFLIHFAVIGCPSPTLPEMTWFEPMSDSLGIMGCVNANRTWSVECRGGSWTGTQSVNCSAVATTKTTKTTTTTKMATRNPSSEENSGPIRFAFDRSAANQERISRYDADDNAELSEYAGFVILATTAVIILIVIVVIIAGLRNCRARSSSPSLCHESVSLRQPKSREDLKLESVGDAATAPSSSSYDAKRTDTQATLKDDYFDASWRMSSSPLNSDYLRTSDD